MRKFFIFFILFISLCSLNFISADYNGETPIIDGNYTIIGFLEDGNFTVPYGVYNATVLVVAGGGGGGTVVAYYSGAGGAGGLVYNADYNLTPFEKITVDVGAGGAVDQNGFNSSFGSISALGGGAGASYNEAGSNGGSGGSNYHGYSVGTGKVGQGNNGGTSLYSSSSHYAGGGGGGCGSVGGDGDLTPDDQGGSGGLGCNYSSVFGTTYGESGYFASGGAGGSSEYMGSSPLGGGSSPTGDGTVNSGGGGAGGDNKSGSPHSPKAGMSGVVIVKYLTPPIDADIPEFITNVNASVFNTLSLSVFWSEEDVISYELKRSTTSDFSNYSSINYGLETYGLYYLPNGTYWFNIRSEKTEANYSDWNNEWYDLYKLTKNDQLNFTAPSVSQSSAVVTFTWNSISDATSYDLQVSTVSNFSTLVFDTNTTFLTKDLTFDTDDTYFYRGRAKDNYYTGEWSDTLNFSLTISAIPFSFSTDFVNLYIDQTLIYYFTGMTPETEYTFNINKLNSDGTFNSLVTTRTVNSDGAGEGDFGYTFASNADYPFSVTYPAGSAELKRHYVKPLPSNFHTLASHRTYVDPWNTGVGVGSVVYNSKSGQLMHDTSQVTQSLYEEDEYVIMHYQIPRPSVLNCSIIFKNIDTGVKVLEIDGRDLYGFNGGMGYGELNFIVIPLNGEVPDIVDANASLNYSYIGDDWHEVTFTKGAYQYYVDLGDDNYSYGESNLLIGNDTDNEWTLTKSASSYVDGKIATYTIAYKTEEIWDAYKYTLMYDASSQIYIIGTDMGSDVYATEVFPTAFTTSTTRTNTVSNAYSDSGYTWIGFWPQAITTDDNTGYEYYLTTTYTITQPTDITAGLDDFLDDMGLGTSVGKLILAMCILVGVLIVLAMIGMPSIVLIIGALATALILTSIGLIPIWAIIILGIVLFLKAMSAFSGGGE